MIDMEDELHRKALDQVGHLLASYEAGKIGPEAFKVGVETIWACLGGIVRLDAFQELMQEANAEVSALPCSPKIEVYTKGDATVTMIRLDTQTRMIATKGGNCKHSTFDVDDEAIAHIEKMRRGLATNGFEELSL